MNVKKKYGENVELVWKDRKRFMGMPLSFTRYNLVKKPGSWCKLIVDVGLMYSSIEEINLYRICDINFHQSLAGKIFNTGTVTLLSNDETLPTLVLKNVKNPYKVRDLISTMVEEERKMHNVRLTEFHDHD